MAGSGATPTRVVVEGSGAAPPERSGAGRGDPAFAADPALPDGSPRGGRTGPGPIPRRRNENCVTSLNTGAAVTPPQIGLGSSRTTATTSRGLLTGANPMNEAMYPWYPGPSARGFWAVPVLPATW